MNQVARFEAGIRGHQVARSHDIFLADGPDLVYAVLHENERIIQIAHPLVTVVVVKQFLKDLRRRCEASFPLHETLQLSACLIAQPMLTAQEVDEDVRVEEGHSPNPAILDSAMIRLASDQSGSRAPGG